ncbi:HAD-IIA family hydrolase [Bacillaceae bacterium]
MKFITLKGFIFDLDGCIYSGSRVYPRAAELLHMLQAYGKKITFVSNNSTDRAEKIRLKLLAMGLPVKDIPILVATELAGSYLRERYGNLTVAVVGSRDLNDALEEAGHATVPLDSTDPIDALVVGRDIEFTYQKFAWCIRQLARGAKLVATNLDMYHPGEDGSLVPETGALVAAIRSIIKTEVEVVGKPAPYPFARALALNGLTPSECIMIGDNIFTDIQGGLNAGMFTVWISHNALISEDTGVFPHKVVSGIKELYEEWAGICKK